MKKHFCPRLTSLKEIRKSGIILSARKGINTLFSLRHTQKSKPMLNNVGHPLGVSVIICTLGNAKTLADSISSALGQNTKGLKTEVIVVLNNPDSLWEEINPKGIKIIKEPQKGISFARNAGAEAAANEILLYIDDDAIAHPDCVAEIARAFAQNPKAAIVGGQILLDIPTPVPAILLPGKEALWSEYRVSYSACRRVKHQYAFPYGACFAVRKSFLSENGGFPTDFGRTGNDYGGGEETALCFNAIKQGYHILIQPKAFVHHRVDISRFTREHVRETIRAGIFTTYRLIQEGYADYSWDLNFLKESLDIARKEGERLNKLSPTEYFYKQCEIDAYSDLIREVEENLQKTF